MGRERAAAVATARPVPGRPCSCSCRRPAVGSPESLTRRAGLGRLQVVVHNLPWAMTWQELKDTFAQTPGVVRADVIIDSAGRSRCAPHPSQPWLSCKLVARNPA